MHSTDQYPPTMVQITKLAFWKCLCAEYHRELGARRRAQYCPSPFFSDASSCLSLSVVAEAVGAAKAVAAQRRVFRTGYMPAGRKQDWGVCGRVGGNQAGAKSATVTVAKLQTIVSATRGIRGFFDFI